MTHHTLQVVPCGKGFLFLYPDRFTPTFREGFPDLWQERFPHVPAMFIEYAKLAYLDDTTPMFEFSGNITPEALDEFRAWWERMNPREESHETDDDG